MSLAEEYGEGAAAAREGENDDYRRAPRRIILPAISLDSSTEGVTLKSSAVAGLEARASSLSGGNLSQAAMISNFTENVSRLIPSLEGVLVGLRSSEKAKWFVQTQSQLNRIIVETELFSYRTQRERVLDIVICYNTDLRAAVVFAPGASCILQKYFENTTYTGGALAANLCIDIVGCYALGIDVPQGDRVFLLHSVDV